MAILSKEQCKQSKKSLTKKKRMLNKDKMRTKEKTINWLKASRVISRLLRGIQGSSLTIETISDLRLKHILVKNKVQYLQEPS